MLPWVALPKITYWFVSTDTVPYQTEGNSTRVKSSFYYYLEKFGRIGRPQVVKRCPSKILSRTKSFTPTGAGYTPWTRQPPLPQASWIAEYPEEWTELEHVLYYSEAKFNRVTDTTPLEESPIKQPFSYNPEAFLPERVRNATYDDMRWFDRSAYIPEGSEEDLLTYLRKELHDALLGLTELQRERFYSVL